MEFPLVAGELEAVDSQLASAEHTLFWHHEGTNPPVAAQGQRSSLFLLGGPWSPAPGTVLPPTRQLPSGPHSHHTQHTDPRPAGMVSEVGGRTVCPRHGE